MKSNSTKKLVIVAAFALSATSVSAIASPASGWATTPANVKAAQDLVSIAKADYEHHLALINNASIRADESKFAEAAAAFEKSRQNYQRLVGIEKEQIAIAIQGGKQTTSATVETPVSTGYREPQNIEHATPAKPVIASTLTPATKTPNLISPELAPQAKPVSTGYREPQNVTIPAQPAKYAEPTKPVLASNLTPASKTPDLIAPELTPIKTPVSTGYREPQNVAIPAQPAKYAEPTKPVLASNLTPATKTPELIEPQAKPFATPAKPAENAGAPHLAAHADPVAPSHLLPHADPVKQPTRIEPAAPGKLTLISQAEPVKQPTRVNPVAPGKLTLTTQAEPTKAPNAPVVVADPQTPSKLFAHAEPTKTPNVFSPELAPVTKTEPTRLVTPATPEARAPENIVKAAPLPAHAPITAEPAAIVTPVSGPYQAPVGKEIAGTGYKGEVTGRSMNLANRLATTGPVLSGDLSGTTGINNDTAQAIYKKLDQSQYVADHAQDKLDAQATNKTVSDLGKLVGTNKNDIATNKGDIANNKAMITSMTKTVSTVRNGVDANAANIKTLSKNIDTVQDNATAYTDKAVDGALDHADKVLDTATQYTDDAVTVETTRATKAEDKLAHGVAEAVKRADDAQDASVAYTDKAVDGAVTYTDKALETAVQYTDDSVADLNKGIATNKNNISTLAGEVAQKENHADVVKDQQRQDKALASETTRATAAESRLTSQTLNNGAAIRGVRSEVQAQGAYIQQNAAGIAQNRQDIAQLNHANANQSKRIDRNSKRIDKLDSDLKDTRRELKSVGNNAAAMAGLHFDGNKDSWALGVGSYNVNGGALAGGLQKSITDHVAVTIQGSFDDASNGMVAAGIHGDFE